MDYTVQLHEVNSDIYINTKEEGEEGDHPPVFSHWEKRHLSFTGQFHLLSLKQQLVFLHTEESHLLFLPSTLLLNFCSHVKVVLQDCPSSVIVSDVGPGDDGATVRPKTTTKHTLLTSF